MVRLKNVTRPEQDNGYGTFQMDAMGDMFFKYEISFNGRPKLLPELLMDTSVYKNHPNIPLDPESILFKTAQKNLNQYFEKLELED